MRHVLLTTTLLLAVACGGDDGGNGEAAGTPSGPPVALSGTVNDHGTRDVGTNAEMVLDDSFFAPTYAKARPGTSVMLRLKNEGDIVHTFTVTELGVDETVQPGATKETSVTLPSSGAVRFFCRFHEGQGMQGAFFFVHGDRVAPGSGGGTGGSPTGTDGDGAYNQ